MSTFQVDLNCDLGESFGVYRIGNDEEIIPLLSSVNIACGFHAGDPSVMRRTVRLAMEKELAIGAHPGLPDLVGFGRRPIQVSPDEVYDMVLYQTGALSAFVKANGGKLHHVKPHGALYNMAAVDKSLAKAIAEALYRMDPELVLYGLAGSELIRAGEELGIMTASEVFADRTYQPNGTLTSRNQPDALILDADLATEQVLQMVKEGTVRTQGGGEIPIKAETICLHGDGPHALEFAAKIHQALGVEGVKVGTISKKR